MVIKNKNKVTSKSVVSQYEICYQAEPLMDSLELQELLE